MEGLNRITFFKSYWDFIEQMSTLKDKYSLVEGICRYAFYGKKPDMTPAASAAFVLILPYLEKSMRRAVNGKAGADKTNGKTDNKPNGKEIGKTVGKDDGKQYGEEVTKEERRKKNNEKEKHKYGEFGWILLTDEQYQKLLAELGQAELERCIRVVDESAQKTGNRCGWKDWNLTLRNCHRDGWGLKPERRNTGGYGGLSGSFTKQESDSGIVYD